MHAATAQPNLRLETLRGILSSATHDASAVMSRWTGGLVTLTLESIEELALGDALGELGWVDRVMTMIVLSWPEPWSGTLILAFDEEGGRTLAGSLVGRDFPSDEGFCELAQSALTETGNILGCAYLNALNRLIEVELVPAPPFFIQDYAASVLQQALVEPASHGDLVLLGKTVFHHQRTNLDWSVLFVPGAGLSSALERVVREPELLCDGRPDPQAD